MIVYEFGGSPVNDQQRRPCAELLVLDGLPPLVQLVRHPLAPGPRTEGHLSMHIEQITAQSGDGQRVDVLFIDGRRAEIASHHTIDPPDTKRRGFDQEIWIGEHDQAARSASPAAADVIRRWARETAADGHVHPGDLDICEPRHRDGV